MTILQYVLRQTDAAANGGETAAAPDSAAVPPPSVSIHDTIDTTHSVGAWRGAVLDDEYRRMRMWGAIGRGRAVIRRR